MTFQLPETLPNDIASLDVLRSEASDAFQELRAKVEAGEDLTDIEFEELRNLAGAIEQIEDARDSALEAEAKRREEAAALLAKVDSRTLPQDNAPEDQDVEDEDESEDEVDTEEAQAVVAEAEKVAKEAQSVTASSGKRSVKKPSFAGLQAGRKVPALAGRNGGEVGFQMVPGVVGYKPGFVGFKDLAEAVDSVLPNTRVRSNRATAPAVGSNDFAYHTLAKLQRDVKEVRDSHALVAAINEATNEKNLPGGSLTAAGGWCAPSETLYDFCEVPTATDLISLPEITIRRGGVRWPVEPDLSTIFDSFQFFFTETQLEAEDVEGNPTAVKNCVSIPCPDTFQEIRLNAVGYCVEAGILQEQGWPELIEWFMRSLAQEHFRAISRRTILDMVTGSTEITVDPGTVIAAGSAVLNAIALQAVNLRLSKGLSRTATVEGVAPSWLHEVIRADLANQEGMETKAVTDAQINAWFSARNIALQFVADWQTREDGLPGDLGATPVAAWPATVNILLYPAGTWFRALSNVIELGTFYPKEQLQVNRYTRFFTEDAIAVAKRCDRSLNVEIPICPSGGIGARETIACNTPAP